MLQKEAVDLLEGELKVGRHRLMNGVGYQYAVIHHKRTFEKLYTTDYNKRCFLLDVNQRKCKLTSCVE